MLNICNYFVKRQIKKQIAMATEAVYSEVFDVDELLQKFSSDGNNISLLRASIAIRVAADVKVEGQTPIVEDVFKEMRSAEQFLHNTESCQPTLDLYRAKAQLSLGKAEIEFSNNKLAPENSYNAIVYQAEKANKGPISYKKRNELKMLSEELDKVKTKIKEQVTESGEAVGAE